jgi:hypothetical protein
VTAGVVCPLHHMKRTISQFGMISLSNGNLQLEMLAYSLNDWHRTQWDYGTLVSTQAAEVMAAVTSLPVDLQIRAIGRIYNVDPEALTGGNAATPQREHYSTGGAGFTEAGVPDGYDTAAGSVIGYRSWKVTTAPDGDHARYLVGAYGNMWPHADSPGHRYTAWCKSRGCKSVPNEDGCGCGFWAYWEPGRSSYQLTVIGAIEGSGKVILGEDGFRCQHAVIRGFAPADPLKLESLRNTLSWYHAPVYDDVTALFNAVGNDQLYSPLARDVAVLSQVPQRALEAYLRLLDLIADITDKCDPGPFQSHYLALEKSFGSSRTNPAQRYHDKMALMQEQALTNAALATQRARLSHPT